MELRLDKWLWAARFFRTRQKAIEAIKGGKVRVNGQRSKPSKTVLINEKLEPIIIEIGKVENNIIGKLIFMFSAVFT